MEKFKKTKILLENLLKIIEKEGKGEVDYQIEELRLGISLLNALLKNDEDKSIELELQRLIKNLYPVRGGLTDFYIWKDDENERIKVNKPLSDIGDELWRMCMIN